MVGWPHRAARHAVGHRQNAHGRLRPILPELQQYRHEVGPPSERLSGERRDKQRRFELGRITRKEQRLREAVSATLGISWWPVDMVPNDSIEAVLHIDPTAERSSCAALSCEELGYVFSVAMESAAAGSSWSLQLPFVVGLRWRRVGARRAIPFAVRSDVLSAGFCALCGADEGLEVDHIIPLSRGGSDDRSNLRPACFHCNRSRGSRLDAEYLA